ncbi:AraC family transcriptional regulator [Planktotalea sp.]|uniref:helix-turn-helix domain-containing protein n=1 Tax=Planktotalea sp. TaxID=2029877 RepID=UPI0032996257
MDTNDISGIDPNSVMTIAQRANGAPWRLGLAHARKEHLLIWVTRGAAFSVVEGRASALNSHNALFIPAGTLFSFTWETSCFGQTVALPVSNRLDWPDDPLLLRVREPKAQLTLTHYIEAIQIEATEGQPLAHIAASAHAQLMMVWAHRQQNQTLKNTAARRLMRAFSALVVQSESSELAGASMADFASKLGVTATHLTRVCRDECGKTAADILTQHLLQRARRMLEDDAMKAVDIARILNFSTPAYFTRFIKTHTGETPSDLRNAAKENRLNSL